MDICLKTTKNTHVNKFKTHTRTLVAQAESMNNKLFIIKS